MAMTGWGLKITFWQGAVGGKSLVVDDAGASAASRALGDIAAIPRSQAGFGTTWIGWMIHRLLSGPAGLVGHQIW